MIECSKLSKVFKYCPALGMDDPEGYDFEASVSFVVNHWRVKSLNGAVLKGRGCKETGKGEWFVTDKAFEKIIDSFKVCHCMD